MSLCVGNQGTCQDHPRPGAHNLQWPEGHAPCADGTAFEDADLGPLQDNGGPTMTTAPGADPAVFQVGTDCPKTDQTGKPRADPCTVGAVELE